MNITKEAEEMTILTPEEAEKLGITLSSEEGVTEDSFTTEDQEEEVNHG